MTYPKTQAVLGAVVTQELGVALVWGPRDGGASRRLVVIDKESGAPTGREWKAGRGGWGLKDSGFSQAQGPQLPVDTFYVKRPQGTYFIPAFGAILGVNVDPAIWLREDAADALVRIPLPVSGGEIRSVVVRDDGLDILYRERRVRIVSKDRFAVSHRRINNVLVRVRDKAASKTELSSSDRSLLYVIDGQGFVVDDKGALSPVGIKGS
jgi:hypothetical protein